MTASLFSSQPAIRSSLPDWQHVAALAFCRGLLRAEAAPTLKVISTAAGPVVVPLSELFRDELEDLYDAEKQIIQALPKMAEAATSRDLKQAFLSHLD